MYRAKKLFEKQGFEVTSCKVDYKVMSDKDITIIDFFPSADNMKTTEIGFRELLGRLFYFVKN